MYAAMMPCIVCMRISYNYIIAQYANFIVCVTNGQYNEYCYLVDHMWC